MHYNNLNYTFQINDVSFQVSMAGLEKFEHSMPAHSHGKDCYEIHYIIAGKGTAVVDGTSYPITKDTLYVTGPYIVHEQIPFEPDPMVEYCIYLRVFHKNKKASVKDSVISIFEEHPFWFGQDVHNIHPIMQMIFFEIEHKNMGHHAMLSGLFGQLIVYIVRNYAKNELVKLVPEAKSIDTGASKLISNDTAVSQLMSNDIAVPQLMLIGHTSLLQIEEAFLYDYKDITLNKLANRMSISPRQAERLLRKYYNSTFQKKRTEARMSAASILLKSGCHSIADVAEMIGYSTSEHFSHAFKRHFGMSASKYQKSITETPHA